MQSHIFEGLKLNVNWDALGVSASLACAIHCALLPLFLTSLPLFGVNIIHNASFEMVMIGLALLIGGISFLHGLRKHHHNMLPLIVFILGIALLFLRQLTELHSLWLLLPGVALIVSAHYINWRLCRKAKHCHTDDCAH